MQKIAVVTHDAGASEYIAHLVNATKHTINWQVFLLVNSPAVHIFYNLALPFVETSTLENLKKKVLQSNPNIILYGTGWQLDFSKMVCEIIQKSHLKSIALLDHWTNYKERFSYTSTPENIIVMDKKAYMLAKKDFVEKNIIYIKNYFLLALQKEFQSQKKATVQNPLFISEPTQTIAYKEYKDKNAYGFTEYSVLKELLENFTTLFIRLHPADDKDKYNTLIEQFPSNKVTLIEPYKESLVTSLRKSNLTIGFDGMALYISYILGVPSLSYMPNSKRELSIPIPLKYKIETLAEINNKVFDTIKPYNNDADALEFEEGLLSIR